MKNLPLHLIIFGLIGSNLLAAPVDGEATWMLVYYQRPQPERVPALIASWHEHGKLAAESSVQPALAGFLSQVLHDSPGLVTACLQEAEKLPDKERDVILHAVWLAHTNTGEVYFKIHDLKKFSEKTPPALDSLKVNGVSQLDFYWGRFCASGQPSCIRAIISALQFNGYDGSMEVLKNSKQPTEAEKQHAIYDATYRAAMYSLEANCRQDPKIFDICESFLEKRVLSEGEEAFLAAILVKIRPEDVKLPSPKPH